MPSKRGKYRGMDERARRIGENEIVYRSVNERIEDLNTTFGDDVTHLTILCECGDLGCAEHIELPITAYESIRADPTWFIVLHGHEVEDVEDVIAWHDAFEVVAKKPGGPAELAAAYDPRAG